MPLSSAQEKQIAAVVEAQVKALQSGPASQDVIRVVNQEYTRRLNEVLTQDQRQALRRYRTEQIMMRGGFPALKFILENAQAPFTVEQEKQARALYDEFDRQVTQLSRDSKGVPERAQLDKLENEALGKVVRLMTIEQRRALAASRQGGLVSKVRP